MLGSMSDKSTTSPSPEQVGAGNRIAPGIEANGMLEESPLVRVLGGMVDPQTFHNAEPAPRPAMRPFTALSQPMRPAPAEPAPPRPFSNLAGRRATPEMVRLASGRVVPVGTRGTSQDGRYQYVVQPDGSVLNVTTGQTSAPARSA
jgi:hypothetical protein